MTETIHILSDWAFTGHVNVAESYSRVLRSLDLHVTHASVNPNTDVQDEVSKLQAGSKLVQCFIPPLLKAQDNFYNIALIFHEWSRMPAAWVKKLETFDQVWVASTYNRQVLKESGFEGVIHYIPSSLDLEQYPQKNRWEVKGPFKFLSVGEWHFRKGFHILAAAFLRAFPQDDQVELHIKTSETDGFRFADPRIKILDQRLDEDEMRSLYSKYDAYVTTSLAEGLGLPVAEAMAARLPVAAVNWSGLTEFCSQNTIIEIPFRLSYQPYCSRPDYYAPGQQCAVAEVPGCADALQKMSALTPADRETMALRARARLANENSETVTANALKKALKPPSEPEKTEVVEDSEDA
jgi:glycosyltransferase involved in cell wall biosynthesis